MINGNFWQLSIIPATAILILPTPRHSALCARAAGLKLLAKLPIRPENARLADEGKVEEIDPSLIAPVMEAVIACPNQAHDYGDGETEN